MKNRCHLWYTEKSSQKWERLWARMKYEQWRVAPDRRPEREALENMGLPPLLAALLAARGVSPGEARRLLSPQSEPLEDPMLMRDMPRAVERIRLALARGERIAVYGDYDVDGITATCLLTEFLAGEGGDAVPYIPDRLEEGYGLNREAVSVLAGRGVTLIVTVDCGITAAGETAFAKSLGVDVVVTDHHACKGGPPPAAAVVDPCRPDCPYPFSGLAGVGVALKLAMAVAGERRAERVFEEYCDLAAVGTIADVMPMTGENRAIVSRGLARLDPPRRVGLDCLIRCAGLSERKVTSVSVGYTLAPRLNAAGRMGRAATALELLRTRDPARGEELALELCELNRERQTIEGEIFQQCVQRLERSPQSGVIVLSDEGWHQGVVGIVASRLTEKYACPAFMICLDRGIGKGSCRSWGGVNLFELLSRCAPLLENFGGHALAAGFTVREENIPALAGALRTQLELLSRQGAPAPVLEADLAVAPEWLTAQAVESLDLLEPCGAGNPRPIFVLSGAQVQSASLVGRGRHLKLRLESRGVCLDAIWFSAGGEYGAVAPGCRVDAAFSPQINEFHGQRSVQLQLLDLRPAPSRAEIERGIYDKFHRGEALTASEARFLLPSRSDFVDLWRWLERQSAAGTVVEDTLARIARSVSRWGGAREVPARTHFCLDVMEERGLIDLREFTGRLQITLRRVEHKVDLDASELMLRLRRAAEQE